MNPQFPLNRRQFLGTTATATVAGLLSIPKARAAAAVRAENEHFWYRLAPEGPYIDTQRGLMGRQALEAALASSGSALNVSEWPI